ncbi:hypothetical protein AB0H34_27955 [Saccharopolyspora shandongensis]|uniref:hypothetical protein n=1 Tax=Saccharopolyspora shandongensis TaxID=418495 RepID=UPI003410AA63
MTVFDEIGQVYACASECEIWDQPVLHTAAQTFVLDATRFLHSLGGEHDSDLWQQSAALVRRCRRLVCTVPIPFTHPELSLQKSVQALKDTISGLRGIADPVHLDRLQTVTARLQSIAADTGDPLGDCARDFLSLDAPEESVVILPDQRFAAAVSAAMVEKGVTARIATQAAISGRHVYNSAVIIGPPSWIRPSILNAPRVRNLALVHYDVFRDVPEVLPLLTHPASSTHVLRTVRKSEPFRGDAGDDRQGTVGTQMSQPSDALLTPEECTPAEEIKASFRANPRQGKAERAGNHVEAYAAVLVNGYHVFLPKDSDTRVLALKTADPTGGHVELLTAPEVVAGDYIALRNRYHHQEIVDRADIILGAEAASLRAVQAAWKEQLWRRCEQHPQSTRGVAEDIRRRGAATANVGYWVTSWCIRPRRKEDFAVVLGYLDSGISIDPTWEKLRRIDSAHRSAGRRYVDDLQNSLSKDNLEQLHSEGWCTVYPMGADSPTLIAQIDYILKDTLQVPLEMLCRYRTTEESR